MLSSDTCFFCTGVGGKYYSINEFGRYESVQDLSDI